MGLQEINDMVAGVSSRDLLTIIMQRKSGLRDVFTYMLCDELETHEGVETMHVEPYDVVELPKVEGPASVFIVTS